MSERRTEMSAGRTAPGDAPRLFGAGAGEVWRLLAAFLGGPVGWSLHLGVSYLFAAIECSTAWRGSDVAIAAASVVLGLATASVGVMAYRTWRRRHPDAMLVAALGDSTDASSLLLATGVLFAALSTLAIAFAGVVQFFVPICG